MVKAVGAAALVFALGGGVMTALTSVLGAGAEAVALTLVGLALFGSGQALGARASAPVTSPSATVLSKAN